MTDEELKHLQDRVDRLEQAMKRVASVLRQEKWTATAELIEELLRTKITLCGGPGASMPHTATCVHNQGRCTF